MLYRPMHFPVFFLAFLFFLMLLITTFFLSDEPLSLMR